MQKDINHQDNQDNSLNQRFHHFVDRGEEEIVAGHHLGKLHAFRQVLACFFKEPVNLPVHFRGIGARGLEHHAGDTGMSIHGTFVGITVLTQLYIGDVLQFQHLAVFGRTDDDVAELLRSNEASRIFHGILIRLIRVLTKRPGGRFDILLCQHSRHIRRYQLVLRHDIRFHPDTHAVVTTHNHHIAHTGDTENLRLQVDTDIVGKKVLVIAVIRAI